MSDYESRRLQQIERNNALLRDLGLEKTSQGLSAPLAKRRKPNTKPSLKEEVPTRRSGRIASSAARPLYVEDDESKPRQTARSRNVTKSGKTNNARTASPPPTPVKPMRNAEELKQQWSSWTSAAPAPERDQDGILHFPDHSIFTPNKTPEEMIREGCFGGSYFRPLYSKTLGIVVEGDWQELPSSWIDGLNVSKVLTSSEYDPSVNKYRVACGQSIEEWEAAGWINHEHDVRGWFQWYCRFYQGRRCDDDERQISRWKKCVGETGRWRRALLKKYVNLGIRNVTDEGDEDEDAANVSPVVHQTCHHWAYEVKQPALDRFWEDGR